LLNLVQLCVFEAVEIEGDVGRCREVGDFLGVVLGGVLLVQVHDGRVFGHVDQVDDVVLECLQLRIGYVVDVDCLDVRVVREVHGVDLAPVDVHEVGQAHQSEVQEAARVLARVGGGATLVVDEEHPLAVLVLHLEEYSRLEVAVVHDGLDVLLEEGFALKLLHAFGTADFLEVIGLAFGVLGEVVALTVDQLKPLGDVLGEGIAAALNLVYDLFIPVFRQIVDFLNFLEG